MKRFAVAGNTRWYDIAGVLLLLGSVFFAGWVARDWIWRNSSSIRFPYDIHNAFNQGMQVVRDGRQLAGENPYAPGSVSWKHLWLSYQSRFDRVVEDARRRNSSAFSLDYTPLRLLIVSIWASHVRTHTPMAMVYNDEFTRPLLWLNFGMGLFAAAAGFLLTHHVSCVFAKRSWRSSLWLATIAASLIWLEPNVLVNGHVWPQWELWIVGFYLFAVLCAMRRWTMFAGALIAVGALLKGQIVMVAPVLVLWPIFAGRFEDAVRTMVGFAVTFLALASPWLIGSSSAMLWLSMWILGAVILPRRPSWKRRWFWISLASSIALATEPSLFSGSWSWWRVGFEFPSRHYPALSMGPVSNLPAILQHHYRFALEDIAMGITIKQLMSMVYGITMIWCAIAAARQERRRSPYILIALLAPWVAMFAFNVQMHERYFYWAAVLSCSVVAVSVAQVSLHFVVSLISLTMMAHQLYGVAGQHDSLIFRMVAPAHPGMGWAVVLLAVIYLYSAMFSRPVVEAEH